MAGPPVDIGTGHEARITPGRAKIDQLPQRQLAAVESAAGKLLLNELLELDGSDLEIARQALAESSDSDSDGENEHNDALEAKSPSTATTSAPTDKTSANTGLAGGTSGGPPNASSSLAASSTSDFLTLRQTIISSWRGWTPLTLGSSLKTFLLDMHTRGSVERRIWKTSDAELSNIIDLLAPDMNTVAKDKYCAFFVQSLYERTPRFVRQKVFLALQPHFRELTVDETGHYTINKIVEIGVPIHLRVLLADLAEDIVALSRNNTSRQIIASLYQSIVPVDLEVLLPSLLEHFTELSSDESGSRLLVGFLARASEQLVALLVDHILAESEDGSPSLVYTLLIDPQGNYVLQAALDYAKGKQLSQLVTETAAMLMGLESQRTRLKQAAAVWMRLEKLGGERPWWWDDDPGPAQRDSTYAPLPLDKPARTASPAPASSSGTAPQPSALAQQPQPHEHALPHAPGPSAPHAQSSSAAVATPARNERSNDRWAPDSRWAHAPYKRGPIRPPPRASSPTPRSSRPPVDSGWARAPRAGPAPAPVPQDRFALPARDAATGQPAWERDARDEGARGEWFEGDVAQGRAERPSRAQPKKDRPPHWALQRR